jgi:MerR family mercuric resistance operon transcriptional regulator
MVALTIAGLARAGGVGVETVRYYQRRGLLQTPQRSAATGHGGSVRRYDEGDVQKLRFIRAAQSAGFTLEQIAELIELDATDDRARARALANERVAALDLKIAEMERARAALHRLAGGCGSGSAGPCPILTSFEQA